MDPHTDPAQWVTHRGGCHCRRVRFEVDAPAARFRLLSGADDLIQYTFNTGAAKHRFCRVCGIKSFYIPRSHPDGVDVNARCLDPGTVTAMTVTPFDDGDRDAATAAIAHLSLD
jgi:hypothetical protein